MLEIPALNLKPIDFTAFLKIQIYEPPLGIQVHKKEHFRINPCPLQVLTNFTFWPYYFFISSF